MKMAEGWQTSPLVYTPALDGLRAVAVLAVIAGHIGMQVGGYHGVTIFFVISGYLITTLLAREITLTSSVDLRRFYLRRFGRLTPALVLVIATTLLWTALHGEFTTHLMGAASALFYLSDFALPILGSDAITPLFTWSWSLAIEEHFYLVWPLALMVLFRFRPIIATGVLMAVVASSWAVRAALHIAGASHERIFYAFDTHVDALALGAIIAISRANRPALTGRPAAWRYIGFLCATGLVVILIRPGILNRFVPFDAGGFGTVSLLSAALIFSLLSADRSILNAVLQSRLLVHLGKLSYSLYLWNMLSIVIFERYVGTTPLASPIGLFWAVGLYLLSLGTYRLVEDPARRWFNSIASRDRRSPTPPVVDNPETPGRTL